VDDERRFPRVNQPFFSGSLLNCCMSAWPNASTAGWYQLHLVIVNMMTFHLGGETHLYSASIITLTLRSLARAQILFRSSYSPFKSLISSSVKGDPGGWTVPSCKITRSVESGDPGNGTGSDNVGRVATRCKERLRSASARGKRALCDTHGQSDLLMVQTHVLTSFTATHVVRPSPLD